MNCFHLWKCPKCHSIHSLDPVDFTEIYREYPPNLRVLDRFAKGTLKNLLRRLEKAGRNKDHTILDYGCGNFDYFFPSAWELAALLRKRIDQAE
jgi:hypothetical protein